MQQGNTLQVSARMTSASALCVCVFQRVKWSTAIAIAVVLVAMMLMAEVVVVCNFTTVSFASRQVHEEREKDEKRVYKCVTSVRSVWCTCITPSKVQYTSGIHKTGQGPVKWPSMSTLSWLSSRQEES